jgi:hypothetical protein
MKHVPSIIFAAALVLPIGTAAAADLTAASSWENARGSILTIDSVDPATMMLTGTYVNNAAGFGCQGTPFPAIGWISGNAITFTVSWTNQSQTCGSITAWTGFYANGQIRTDWNLVYPDGSGSFDIMQGTDVFYPVTAATTGAPPAK